ncbi:MAG: hypothetical protein V3U65_14750 [Granulosicoccaceae bacterium]
MMQAPEEQEIFSAIDAIKGHRIFNRSPLMCAFLSYVTLETIQGRESRISAYSVAIDALGKPTDFDPQMDPSVRVLAKRLRDSLARYYKEATGYNLCVVLTPGSYVPSFYRTELSVDSSPVNSPSNIVQEAADNPATATGRMAWTPPVVFYQTDDLEPADVVKKNSRIA